MGAINTIVNDDGYLRGYNTDGTGHIRAIKESGFDIKGKTMVLLGGRRCLNGYWRAGGQLKV